VGGGESEGSWQEEVSILTFPLNPERRNDMGGGGGGGGGGGRSQNYSSGN